MGHTRNIATPGFVVNGKGWNGWFYKRPIPVDNSAVVGELSAEINNDKVEVNFDAEHSLPPLVQAHVAILGFDQVTKVTRGENRGRHLPHDFVVIGYDRVSTHVNGKQVSTKLTLPNTHKFNSAQKAIVVWLSDRFDPKPIQVVGDWL